MYSILRSFQDFKLPPSKSWDKKSISLAASFVKHTGLSSIWIYLLNYKNCKRRQARISGLEEKCVFQLIIKISLKKAKSFLSNVFFKKSKKLELMARERKRENKIYICLNQISMKNETCVSVDKLLDNDVLKKFWVKTKKNTQ